MAFSVCRADYVVERAEIVFLSVSEGEGVVNGFAYEDVDVMLFAFGTEELEMFIVKGEVMIVFVVIEEDEFFDRAEFFQISVILLEAFVKCLCCRLSAYVKVAEIRRLHNYNVM